MMRKKSEIFRYGSIGLCATGLIISVFSIGLNVGLSVAWKINQAANFPIVMQQDPYADLAGNHLIVMICLGGFLGFVVINVKYVSRFLCFISLVALFLQTRIMYFHELRVSRVWEEEQIGLLKYTNHNWQVLLAIGCALAILLIWTALSISQHTGNDETPKGPYGF